MHRQCVCSGQELWLTGNNIFYKDERWWLALVEAATVGNQTKSVNAARGIVEKKHAAALETDM